jgi:putative ABC transport system permease protein
MAIILFWSALVLLAGYYPAVVLSGFDPIRAISGKLNGNAGKSKRFGNALIGFQYTIALLLLISTFVIVTQVTYLLKNDSGFTKDAIITVNLPRGDFFRLQTFRNILASLPGVSAASLQHSPPMDEKTDGGFIKYDHNERWSDFIVRDRWADDKFVATYDLTLLAGRNITLHDSSTEVLVNETLLRKLGISDPHTALGRNIVFDNASLTGTIVGVVKDFHHRSLQNNIEPLAIYAFPGVFS